MSYIGRQRPTETTSSVLRSTYTGDGSTTTYALPGPVANETSIIATINGVTQQDGAYSTNGSQIIFDAAPALGDAIEIRTISDVGMSYAPMAGSVTTGILADLAVTTGKIADNSITTAKIAAGAVVQADIGTNVAGTGPAFSAYTGTGTSLTSGTTTKLLFDTEEYDTNNNFASSRFTPTVAGYYQINASAVAIWQSGESNLNVYKNGAVYKNLLDINGAYSYTLNGSCLVYLNGSTDYVEIYSYVQNATTTIVGQNRTWVNGYLARAA